jgi:hypothetical protein
LIFPFDTDSNTPSRPMMIEPLWIGFLISTPCWLE